MNKIFTRQKGSYSRDAVKEISTLLNSGSIGVLPTATIYGLSCIYNNEDAVNRIYGIKKRKAGTPFILLISSVSQIRSLSHIGSLAKSLRKPAIKLMAKYWDIENPCPLTLVLPKSDSVGEFISGGRSTIAVRLAGLEVIRKIIDSSGPIVSTSATLSGTASLPRTLKEIPDEIINNTDFLLDHVQSLEGSESTIVDLTGENPELLRQGAVDYDDILKDLKNY